MTTHRNVRSSGSLSLLPFPLISLLSLAIGIAVLPFPSSSNADDLNVEKSPRSRTASRDPVTAQRPAARAHQPLANTQRSREIAPRLVLIEKQESQGGTAIVTLFPDELDNASEEDATLIQLFALPKRPWGPEQTIGQPNTREAGDQKTAWASNTTDGHTEWLQLEYVEPINAKELDVYETFNPGALFKVSVFNQDGNEVTVWQGIDPTPVSADKGVSRIRLDVPFKVKSAKIYLDSTLVPGFNEIDAVGLRDADGQMHWAINVKASSTFAAGIVAPLMRIRSGDLLRLKALEEELTRLRQEAKRVRQLEEELEQLKKQLRKRQIDNSSR